MTTPDCTPLLLVSQFNEAVNQDEPSRILDAIIHASALLQGSCNRRFDEYLVAPSYTARLVTNKGDLLDNYRLSLNADLRTLTTLAVNIPFGGAAASGTAVTGAIINTDGFIGGAASNSGRELALDEYAGGTSFIASQNPRNSINVAGVWGFGGRWVDSGAKVSVVLDTDDTDLTVDDITNIEAGMTFKIGTEYLYCEDKGSSTVTVSRAFNGSTAAAHSINDTVYYWQAHPLVQKLIRRLVQWDEQQKKAPLVQNVAVGDFSFPAATDGLPKDVYDTIYSVGLVALHDRIVKA